jgi:hypothetical protein
MEQRGFLYMILWDSNAKTEETLSQPAF